MEGGQITRTGMLVLLTLFLLLTSQVEASCQGSCGACARRYGCMTPAWGKCCTQFFMHNGRKRSSSAPGPREDTMESFIEYVRLKSKRVNTRLEDDTRSSTLMNEPYLRPDISRNADTRFHLGGDTERNHLQDGVLLTSGPDESWEDYYGGIQE